MKLIWLRMIWKSSFLSDLDPGTIYNFPNFIRIDFLEFMDTMQIV